MSSGDPVVVGPGQQLGRYLLGDELGAGGMATVYRARDTELRRDVAVKVLFPHLARKDEVTRRFHREARAAAGLEHPNILRVYDVGVAAGAGGPVPYIVMELVRGVSLREVVDAEGALLAEGVACIGALLCDALAVAHKAGVIHRDVKPANVMLADDGRLLLADFGVARLDDDDSLVTRTGALLGTVSFMAPEQGQGGTVDARADLYAVGVTLYQLGTGALPFTGAPVKILADAQKGAVPAERRHPPIGAALSRIIARLMAPDPAARPTDAAAVAAELRAFATAGGLGDAADELRDFALDRAGWTAKRTPAVVRTLVERAARAADRRELPTALALCDRALATAPGDAGASALAERLTRAGGRRRVVIAAGAAVVAIAAVVGGAMLWPRGRAASTVAAVGDAAVSDGAVRDAAMSDAMTSDTAMTSDAMTSDAVTSDAVASDAVASDAVTRDAMTRDAAAIDARLPAIDAGARRDAGTTVGLALDAGARLDAAIAIPPDASRAPEVDAAAAPGRVTFVFDTWCDLFVDGEPRGRADGPRAIDLAPGRHRVECKQGLGQGAWTDTITVAAGAAQRVEGSLVPPVEVENTIADAVRIRGRAIARGARASLRPGRQRVEILRGGKVVATDWVTLPSVARCTLRESPELDCVP